MDDSRIRKLCRSHGLLSNRQIEIYRPWVNQRNELIGGVLSDDLNSYQILHEVAHFQIASPTRRAQVNFGLGDDTFGLDSTLTKELHIREEVRALVFTLFLFEEFDIPTQASTIKFRGQEFLVSRDSSNLLCLEAKNWLLARGLLDNNLLPTRELNQKED